MFGDSFFTGRGVSHVFTTYAEFSSPCLGILFSQERMERVFKRISRFSSPCLGILFSLYGDDGDILKRKSTVFVPMFGDSFFTRWVSWLIPISRRKRFRPHVWGFFFHSNGASARRWSKCFRPHVWGFFFHLFRGLMIHFGTQLFSSPCLGILFSRGPVHRQGRNFR